MQIAQAVGGYSLGQADLLRKAMGKKSKEIMERERARFVEGATGNGYDAAKASAIFDYIEPFARYGFNKSHSVAYALVAYHTAWLKAHYPRHFMAALLSSEMDKTDSVVKFITECAAMNIQLLPPDINESNQSFTVVGDNIRFGLGAVKGVGSSAVESILEGRRTAGRFSALQQFCESIDLRSCNKKVLEALIKSGCFDSMGRTRKALFDDLERTVDSAVKSREEKELGQSNLFGMAGGGDSAAAVMLAPMTTAAAATAEWNEDEKLAYEKETLGFYITGHPLNKFADELKSFADATTETLHKFVDRTVNIGGIVSQLKKSKIKKGPNEGKMMAKFILDDQFGSVETVVFSDLFSKHARWLENGVPVLVTSSVKDTGGVAAGRSAALASAEAQAQQIDDEYGGHPEAAGFTSGAAWEGRGESDVEPSADAVAAPLVANAAPVTPELNALDIIPLEGIRDRKVRELSLEIAYRKLDDERIQRIREVLESHSGEIPVTIYLLDPPESLATLSANGRLRVRINQHFRVTPGKPLSDAVAGLDAALVYAY